MLLQYSQYCRNPSCVCGNSGAGAVCWCSWLKRGRKTACMVARNFFGMFSPANACVSVLSGPVVVKMIAALAGLFGYIHGLVCMAQQGVVIFVIGCAESYSYAG